MKSLLPPGVFVNDDDVKLKEQIGTLYELRGIYNNLTKSGTDSNPKIESVYSKIESIKEDILSYLSQREDALKLRVEDLKNDIVSFERKIKTIPKTQRQVLNIERRLAVNEELYAFLLSKRAETVIAKAGLVPGNKNY